LFDVAVVKVTVVEFPFPPRRLLEFCPPLPIAPVIVSSDVKDKLEKTTPPPPPPPPPLFAPVPAPPPPIAIIVTAIVPDRLVNLIV
jgi:hypothetical protein